MDKISTNKKSFRLTTVARKSFSLFLNNFQFATTLIFKIKNKIGLTFVVSSIGKLFTTVNMKKIKFNFVTKLTGKISSTINLKTIKILVALKQLLKIVVNFNIPVTLTFVSKAVQKTLSVIHAGKTRISCVGTFAQFFTLGYHDPFSLGALDATTLAEMDYTSI
jgi:hypothetical protein